MKLRVLALDYDGTIAERGALDPEVRAAIAELRESGLVVVLVTGRILADLRRLVGDLRIFDAVVAENGAVTAFPRAGRSAHLAPHCPRELTGRLRERGVDARAGRCIVELEASDAHAALEVVRELELPLTLHFNRGRVMVMPPAVSKATGLREALRTMRLSPHNAIGIGDAENDHELLAVCEVGAAVAWGSAALRAAADVVIEGSGPRDVARYLREVAAGPRLLTGRSARRSLVLGRDARGELVQLALRGRNVLIAGDPRSGKSWVAGLLCEQLVLAGYCLCLIDPEGDYSELETLPGVQLLGGDAPPPSPNELIRALRHADVSVILDLSRLDHPDKRAFVRRTLGILGDLRRETGLPHRIVIDEAHYFLDDPEGAALLDDELAGYTLVTYRVSGLDKGVLADAACILVTREGDADEVRLLHGAHGDGQPVEHWIELLGGLEIDEACLLPRTEEAGRQLRRFRLAPRLTHHVRHRHKYFDVPVSEAHAFHFRLDDAWDGPVASSLQELVQVLESTPVERIEGHLRRGDLSRWVGEVFRDAELAGQLSELEEEHRLGTLADFGGAAVHVVRERYEVDGEPY